jgi:hypothetical protein
MRTLRRRSRHALDEVSGRHAARVLASVGGNKVRAAKILGIDLRNSPDWSHGNNPSSRVFLRNFTSHYLWPPPSSADASSLVNPVLPTTQGERDDGTQTFDGLSCGFQSLIAVLLGSQWFLRPPKASAAR